MGEISPDTFQLVLTTHCLLLLVFYYHTLLIYDFIFFLYFLLWISEHCLGLLNFLLQFEEKCLFLINFHKIFGFQCLIFFIQLDGELFGEWNLWFELILERSIWLLQKPHLFILQFQWGFHNLQFVLYFCFHIFVRLDFLLQFTIFFHVLLMLKLQFTLLYICRI